jgi:AbiV family abortive infection protein
MPGEKTLARLKEEIHINAVRLFCDGCTLYRHESYSSANALAILSLEELGKLEMVDHICDDICLNPEHDPQQFLDFLFSRRMFFSHTQKQTWACSFNSKHLKRISEGILDRDKQNSLYVGYSKLRIRSPRRISSSKAYAQLETSFNKIKEVGDLGFNGFHCLSDAESEKKAKQYCVIAEQAFLSLEKPVKRNPSSDLPPKQDTN